MRHYIIKTLTSLSLLVILLACKSNDKENITILNYDKENLFLSFSADRNQVNGAFIFTATDDWYIDIENTSEDKKESWVNISPMSGGISADINLQIEMDTNDSESPRQVNVNIIAGGYKLVLVVEQKGIQPKTVITSITLDYNDENKDRYTFNYYGTWQLRSVNPVNKGIFTVHYSEDMITENGVSNGGLGTIQAENRLDEEGNVYDATQTRTETILDKVFKFITKSTYTYDNGTISTKSTTMDNNGASINKSNSVYIWDAKNLSENATKKSLNGAYVDTNRKYFTYTEHENNMSLDLNFLISSYHNTTLDLCTLIKRTGEESQNLLSTAIYRNEDKAGFWDQTKYRFEYKFNEKGHVTEVKRYSSFSYHSLPTENILDERLDVTYEVGYDSI